MARKQRPMPLTKHNVFIQDDKQKIIKHLEKEKLEVNPMMFP